MQLHCKKCGKDVTMETEIQNSPPYRIINNHKCDLDVSNTYNGKSVLDIDQLKSNAIELRDKIAWEFKLASALEKGFVL